MTQRNTLFLKLIAVFKLVKAVSLIVLGIGAIRLGHSGDPTDKVSELVMRLGFNPAGQTLEAECAGGICSLRVAGSWLIQGVHWSTTEHAYGR